ncbi:type II toxin-antitoxin system CcdA family antitoxin [Buttiauxella gaviniae]|uniref:Type II toxin-antitoxin system CcdA family antitoxin n=1 Tax=Buttiauxella gaviniae TaxID=82990 RepID=A0ABV3NTH6_9ENTR
MPGKREVEVKLSVRPTDVLLEKHHENKAAGWYEENREAIDALNEFVEENGSFSDFHRSF